MTYFPYKRKSGNGTKNILGKKGHLQRNTHIAHTPSNTFHTYISQIHDIHFVPNSGCGEIIEAPKKCVMVVPEKRRTRRYLNYLEDCWPCGGGLSAVNDIGMAIIA